MIPVQSSTNRHLNLSMIFLETMLIPDTWHLGHAYAPDTNWLAAADVYSWCRYCFLLQSFQLSIIVNPFLTLLIYFLSSIGRIFHSINHSLKCTRLEAKFTLSLYYHTVYCKGRIYSKPVRFVDIKFSSLAQQQYWLGSFSMLLVRIEWNGENSGIEIISRMIFRNLWALYIWRNMEKFEILQENNIFIH